MSETLGAVVERVVGTDIGLMVDAAVDAEYRELCHASDRIECRRALLLAALHHRGIPAGDGASSTPAWVQWQTGQSWRDANTSLRAGVACESLPAMAKAWAQAEISTSAALEICAGIPKGHEEMYRAIEDALVDFASAHDWRGLRASIAYVRRCADALDDREPTDLNGLRHSKVGDRWATNGDYDDLSGTIIDTALNAAMAKMAKPSESDALTTTKRRADASVEIHRFYLDHADLPREGGQAPHIALAIDWDTYISGLPSSMGIGPSVSAAQIAAVLADCTISPVILDPDGLPLYVGRAERYATPAQRLALTIRDGGCRFPGCDRKPGWCISHHLDPWDLGGLTDLDRLILLCRHHHRIVHSRGWTYTFDGTTFTVTTPDGRTLNDQR